MEDRDDVEEVLFYCDKTNALYPSQVYSKMLTLCVRFLRRKKLSQVPRRLAS